MAKNKNNQAIWNKRIKKNSSLLFQEIGSSINVDKRLFKEDIKGSLVHVEMLSKQKIISLKIKNKIIKGLKRIEKEGMGSVFERHSTIGQYTRDGIKKLGLQIFPESESIASNTCTAIKVPDNIDGSELVRKMRTEHNVVLAGGQASLSGQIFRIGHMGITPEKDIQETLDALATVLPEIGFKI